MFNFVSLLVGSSPQKALHFLVLWGTESEIPNNYRPGPAFPAWTSGQGVRVHDVGH